MKKMLKNLFLIPMMVVLFLATAAPSPSVYHPPVIVEELDGSPSVKGTTKILVTNGTLTKNGSQATLDIIGAGGGVGLGLSDPNADRIYFWDDGAGANAFLSPGNSIAITGTTLDTIQDIRITSEPTFLSETLSRVSLGTTSTDGLVLINPTASAAGAQQISPRLRWTGHGWKTDATASDQVVDYIAELVPVQGAANPQARLDFNYQINGEGYQATPVISLLNNNLGLGTKVPNELLHLKGDTPSIRLENTATGLKHYGLRSYGTGFSFYDFNVGEHRLFIDTSGNIGLGATSWGSSAVKVLSLAVGTAPTTSPADIAQIWVADVNAVAGQAGIHIRDELGGTYKIGAGISWASVAEPTCAAGIRGTVNYVAGGAGVVDTFRVCTKDVADAYAWRVIY